LEYTEATRHADEVRREEAKKAKRLNYPDTKPLPDPVFEPFDIVLTGEGPHMEFVDIQSTFGHREVKVGEFWTDDDDWHRITIRPGDRTSEELWNLADKRIPFSLHFDPQTDPYETPWTLEIGSAAYGGMTPSETAKFTLDELARSCQCGPCQTTGPHKSDCAVHGVDTAEGIVYHLDCTCREPDIGTPKRFSVVITERPGEAWLFNLDRFNSEDDIEISEEVGRTILALMARDEEE
jgi:hypothetical protein